MKTKSLFISLFIIAIGFCSCQNNQSKAEKLAKYYIQSVLYVPDSYEAISTTFDSAFYSPIMDELTINKAQEILEAEKRIPELERELERIERNIKSAKSSMSIWSDSRSSYAKNQYQEAKDDYAKALNQQSEKEAEIQETSKSISDGESFILERMKTEERMGQFVGWGIVHKYRAETRGGMKTIGNVILFADSTFNEVRYVIDEDDQEQTEYLERILDIIEK